jgi:hypothetical protein
MYTLQGIYLCTYNFYIGNISRLLFLIEICSADLAKFYFTCISIDSIMINYQNYVSLISGEMFTPLCPSVLMSHFCPNSNSTTVQHRNIKLHKLTPHGSRMIPIDFKITGSKVKVSGKGNIIRCLR